MKQVFLILVIFCVTMANAQSNFIKGYDVGYGEGYCYEKGIGCIKPITPIPPISKIGESSDSYQDGYKRGFTDGLNQQKSVSTTNHISNDDRKRYETSEPNFIDDFIYKPNYDLSSLKNTADALIELNKKSLESLDNEDYDNAIYYSDTYINISNKIKFAENSAPFSIKAIAYINKSDYLNSYNNLKKSQILGFNDNVTINLITSFVNDYLKKEMENNNYLNVKYFCENVWYADNYTNYFLGLSYYYLGNFKEAKKTLKKITDFEPAKKYLNAIENKQTIPNPFTQKKETKDFREIENYIQKSYQLSINQEYEKAIATVLPLVKEIESQAISDKNQIFAIYFLLSGSYYSFNNFNQAESFATKAIDNAITTEIGDLYFLRSMARSKIQLYQDSNSDLDYLINNYQFINYAADLATLYNNKACNFIFLKEYDEAKRLVDKALSLNNNLDYIWDTKGEIEYHIGNYSECVKAMTNVIKIKESANSYYYRGLAHIKLGNQTEGCMDFSKAIELGENKALYEKSKYCK